MPISAPYTYAKTALIRLSDISTSLEDIKRVIARISQLESKVLTAEENIDFLSSYKESIRNLVQNRISRANAEALILALASACESDDKNSQLTPVISGVPVNPIAGANAIEQAAMILDGATSANDLLDLITSINQILN